MLRDNPKLARFIYFILLLVASKVLLDCKELFRKEKPSKKDTTN